MPVKDHAGMSVMSETHLAIIINELNRRIKRGVSKARLKQKEYKFQDERIHRARIAALSEFLEFVLYLRANMPDNTLRGQSDEPSELTGNDGQDRPPLE